MKNCPRCTKRFDDTTRFCPTDGEPLVDDLESLVGTTLDGAYYVEALLGRGGMGAVFRARHVLLGDTVAIKTLPRELASSPEWLSRFRREGQAARKFRHEHAVSVHDLRVSSDGLVYMVLEYVAGHTLRDEIRHRGRLRPDEAVELLLPVARALDAAHDAGVIHRDLKPDNVMIADDGTRRIAKLLDLGIAKLRETTANETITNLTTFGQVLGTPGYMSPEQWGIRPADGALQIDGRTDVYSLAVTVYELVAGHPPFRSSATDRETFISEMRSLHCEAAPTPLDRVVPGVTSEFARCVERGLAKNRAERPPTPGAFVEQLLVAAHDVTVGGRAGASTIITPPPRPATLHETTNPVAATATAGSPERPETVPDAVAPTVRIGDGAPAGRYVAVALVCVALVAVAAAAALWFARRQAAQPVDSAASERSEPNGPTSPPALEAFRYAVAVDGWNDPTTGFERLPLEKRFRLLFESGSRGRLLLVTHDENERLVFLGPTNDAIRVEPGRTVTFPTGEDWIYPTPTTVSDPIVAIFLPDSTGPLPFDTTPGTPIDGDRLTAFRDFLNVHTGTTATTQRRDRVLVSTKDPAQPTAVEIRLSFEPTNHR